MGRDLIGETTFDIEGRSVPVRLHRNRRAKRIILRVEPGKGAAPDALTITLPWGAGADEGLDWLRKNTAWAASKLAELPIRIPFTNGAVVPYLGVDHRICHDADARRGVWCEDGEIRVSGAPEHTPRRVADWLKREARRECVDRATVIASRMGRTFGRISIRDPRSRWGSCASNGNLNFSWRLILAPEFVLEYVVVHEVAHLQEPHHGPAFWQLVDTLTDHTLTAKAWISAYGQTLHRYG